MLTNELAYMSATEIALKIRRRDLSPVEVAETLITRIEERNPSLNAIVYCGFADARAAAKKAEEAVIRGEALGPLHGVPVSIKDNHDHKPGWISTIGGVRALKDNVATGYCFFAEKIEKAGAIILGKTNSPTFGMRGTTDNYLFGASKNPFNTAKNTGGSSGGAAAAVADGFMPIAEGTDGGGSIRIPSAWCGVYGYKASFGRIAFAGASNAFGAASLFVHEGPITRTVEDAAAAVDVMSGYDPRDPFSLPDKIDLVAATRASIRGKRIGLSRDFGMFPVDPRIAALVEKAAQAFTEAGAIVEEVDIKLTRDQNEYAEMWCRVASVASLQDIYALQSQGVDLLGKDSDDLSPEYRALLGEAQGVSARKFFDDLTLRTEMFHAVQAAFEKFDLIVSPTLACMPVDNASDGNTVGPTQINGVKVNPLIGWCMTYPLNFTGHPAASIPAGFIDGLPVGMQIAGRRYADEDVIAASAVFERLRPWRDSYRICDSRSLA